MIIKGRWEEPTNINWINDLSISFVFNNGEARIIDVRIFIFVNISVFVAKK
jgi:hypothetical protein